MPGNGNPESAAGPFTDIPPNTLRMVIDLDLSTMSIKVGGPLDQRVFCYAMLEMAREIMIKRGIEQKSASGSGLVVVRGALPPQ